MKDKNLNLINRLIVGAIAVIGVILFIMLVLKDSENAGGAIDTILRFTYIVLLIAVIVSIWVWFKEMISHPGKLKQVAIVTVIFLAIVFFSKYVLASNKAVHYFPNIDVDAKTSNWVDTGLYTFYILGTIAVLLMFLSPVLSMIGGGKGSSNYEEYEEEGVEVAE